MESSAWRAWWRGSSRMSASQRTASVWMRPVTASLRRGGAHQGARSLSTSANGLGVAEEPPVQLLQGQVDDAVVQVVADHLDDEGAEQRRDRLLAEPRHEHRLHEVGDVLVLDLAERDRGHVGDLVDHLAGVARAG